MKQTCATSDSGLPEYLCWCEKCFDTWDSDRTAMVLDEIEAIPKVDGQVMSDRECLDAMRDLLDKYYEAEEKYWEGKENL
jgi:hypothetical protein